MYVPLPVTRRDTPTVTVETYSVDIGWVTPHRIIPPNRWRTALTLMNLGPLAVILSDSQWDVERGIGWTIPPSNTPHRYPSAMGEIWAIGVRTITVAPPDGASAPLGVGTGDGTRLTITEERTA